MTGPPTSAEAVQAASMAFKTALIERALGAELTHHRGHVPGATEPEDAGNHRNGASGKTVLTEYGPPRIDVPRDRQGSFEPVRQAARLDRLLVDRTGAVRAHMSKYLTSLSVPAHLELPTP